jgi:hypothetical protein
MNPIICPLCLFAIKTHYIYAWWWCESKECFPNVEYYTEKQLWVLNKIEYTAEQLERFLKLKAFW